MYYAIKTLCLHCIIMWDMKFVDRIDEAARLKDFPPPKGVIESNFICTLAMSAEDWFDFYCNTKLSESSDMTKHWVIHYYSVL